MFHALGRTVILHAVKEQDSDYRYECKAQSTDNSDSQTIGVLTKVGTYSECISTRILFGGVGRATYLVYHIIVSIHSVVFIKQFTVLKRPFLFFRGFSSCHNFEDLFWLLVNIFSVICRNAEMVCPNYLIVFGDRFDLRKRSNNWINQPLVLTNN